MVSRKEKQKTEYQMMIKMTAMMYNKFPMIILFLGLTYKPQYKYSSIITKNFKAVF
jgi:hypothetical protein